MPVARLRAAVGDVEVDTLGPDSRDIPQGAADLRQLTAAREGAGHQRARRGIVVDDAIVQGDRRIDGLNRVVDPDVVVVRFD